MPGTNDLFGGDLPSDSESDDSDYVTENEGSSSSSIAEEVQEEVHDKKSYKRELRRLKIARTFATLMEKETEKFRTENHADVLIDPLMLEFQKRQPREVPNKSIDGVIAELSKYSNISADPEPVVDVRKYKEMARSTLIAHEGSHDASAVQAALAGLSNAQVEVEEEVRFAGEVIKMKKMVERTSAHASRFERRKRAIEESATLGGGSLGSFQAYLNDIKSHRAVSSVEKSATDWNQLKMSTEGMEQALKIDRGFLDKQAFLIRSEAKEDDIRREARRRKLMESNVEQNLS